MALTEQMRNRITDMCGTRPSDLTPTAWDVMGVLRGCTGAATVTGSWSHAEIAGLANCAPSTARRAIQALTERGYIAVYETAHANRYRLSSGDATVAEENIARLESERVGADPDDDALAVRALEQVQSPMFGIADAAARIALPGRPVAGRRQVIRPRRTGVRMVVDHEGPRGRVFRLVPVKCRESARALAEHMRATAEVGEIRVGWLARQAEETTEPVYDPRHVAEEPPRWHKVVVIGGMSVVILGSIIATIAMAASTSAAENEVPRLEPIAVQAWKTNPTPGGDEPTSVPSLTAGDHEAKGSRGYAPGGEAIGMPAWQAPAHVAPLIERDVTVTTPGVDTAVPAAYVATEEPSEADPAAAVPEPSTFVTGADGTVWEIGPDGTVLGGTPKPLPAPTEPAPIPEQPATEESKEEEPVTEEPTEEPKEGTTTGDESTAVVQPDVLPGDSWVKPSVQPAPPVEAAGVDTEAATA